MKSLTPSAIGRQTSVTQQGQTHGQSLPKGHGKENKKISAKKGITGEEY